MIIEDVVTSEPVPSATQLALVALASAVDGYLRSCGTVDELRTTIHRSMSRNGLGYLQQACAYSPMTHDWKKKVGRVFPVTEGIVGAAFGTGKVWRTKSFGDVEALRKVLQEEMVASNDSRGINEVGRSFLAVPFIGPSEFPVLILFSECKTLNFFVDEQRINSILAICNCFCSNFDQLEKGSNLGIQNYPLAKGIPYRDTSTLYESMQEELDLPPPSFAKIEMFNFDIKP